MQQAQDSSRQSRLELLECIAPAQEACKQGLDLASRDEKGKLFHFNTSLRAAIICIDK